MEWNAFSSAIVSVAPVDYIEHIMRVKLTVAAVIALALCGGAVGIQQVVVSKIVAQVERKMPRASGISASMPLIHLPSNLSTDSIKSVDIKIDSYFLKQNNTKTSLEIAAKNISKSESNVVGSLAVTATISESTIVQLVSLSSKGLSLSIRGTNVLLSDLGNEL